MAERVEQEEIFSQVLRAGFLWRTLPVGFGPSSSSRSWSRRLFLRLITPATIRVDILNGDQQ